MVSVVVLGGGGREHAVAHALARSSLVHTVYVIPGNGGTATMRVSDTQIVNVPAMNVNDLIAFCKEHNIALVFVGPEQPLVEGIADRLKQEGIKCFGPSAAAAPWKDQKNMPNSSWRGTESLPRHSLYLLIVCLHNTSLMSSPTLLL